MTPARDLQTATPASHGPRIRKRIGWLLAIIAGVVSVAGFAPFYFFPVPILALGGLFWLWSRSASRWYAASLGFAFGLGLFGAGVSWVYVSLHQYGGMPASLSVIATVLFCIFLALFPAVAGYFQGIGRPGFRTRFLLLMPSLWVGQEWLRGWLFTGFPWLTLGYSQVPASPLAGLGPVLGVYGVSLGVAFSGGLLACAIHGWLRWRSLGEAGKGYAAMALTAMGLLAALWTAAWALGRVAWTTPVGSPVTVSLLQGNIPQDMKWEAAKVDSTLQTYLHLVLASKARLIILPETAIPLFYNNVPPGYLEALKAHARENGGDILFGLPEYENEYGDAYFNSVMSLGSAPAQTYRKHHLVPFGEFIPFKPIFGRIIDFLHIPLSDFSRGAAFQHPMGVAGEKAAVNICYEDAFGNEIIRQLPAATLLVNVSNDAWFGDSIAPYQHLQISQMRALETGRYVLRATNTGVTAIVDQHGVVRQRLAEFVTGALNGTAQGYQGATPFVRWGNWVAISLVGVLLALGLLAGYRGRGSP